MSKNNNPQAIDIRCCEQLEMKSLAAKFAFNFCHSKIWLSRFTHPPPSTFPAGSGRWLKTCRIMQVKWAT